MDTNTQTNAQIDPLNEDLGSIDTSFPLWQPGQLLDFKVSESIIIEPTDPSKAPRWKVTVESLTPCMSQENQQLQPGVKAFLSAQLAPTGKATMDIVKKAVAAIAQGTGATKTPGRTLANIRDWAPQVSGATFRAKTKIRAASGAYDAQNDISWVK